jgi:exodeoxyribonuclease V alpha subunit
VSANPYILYDDKQQRGWSFLQVAQLATLLGVDVRLRATRLVMHVVRQLMHDSGDTVLASAAVKAQLRRFGYGKASKLLGVPDHDRLEAYCDALEQGETIEYVRDGEVVLAAARDVERRILHMATAGEPDDLLDMRKLAAAELQVSPDHALFSAQQVHAVTSAFGPARVCLIIGDPGCGKSACCDGIAHVAEQLGLNIHFVAFTWLAAQRVNEACRGKAAATSIHRYIFSQLFKAGGALQHDDDGDDDSLFFDKYALRPKQATSDWEQLDLLVVDEASMASTSILGALLGVLPTRCRLVLIGDPGQLPPISYGQPFADLVAAWQCQAAAYPVSELTHVFRTDQPHITEFARACRQGARPGWMVGGAAGVSFADFEWVNSNDAALILERVMAIVQHSSRAGHDFQIIAAGWSGPVGILALNATIAAYLRAGREKTKTEGAWDIVVGQHVMYKGNDGAVPKGTRGMVVAALPALKIRWLARRGTAAAAAAAAAQSDQVVDVDDLEPAFVEGDAVMYIGKALPAGICNGQRGQVLEVTAKGVLVEYEIERCKKKVLHELAAQLQLQLAYAITVHKFQGNETSHAVVVVHASHGRPLMTRKLLYTAVTRGKERVTLLCDEDCLDTCLRTQGCRTTYLGQALAGKV